MNVAPGKSIRLEPAMNGEPTSTPLTLDEIRYINNGLAFKTGMLEFPSDIEDEVYNELRIDATKVLKLNELRDILINPTKDGLIKILSITSLSDFDRVRGQFQRLKYEGYKLTLDIADIIERRTKELFNNQIKSDIKIEDANLGSKDNGRVDDLERQIAEMKLLIESLTNNATEEKESIVDDQTIETSTIKKTPGRPKKSN